MKRSVHDSIGPVRVPPPWRDLSVGALIWGGGAVFVIGLFAAAWTMLP